MGIFLRSAFMRSGVLLVVAATLLNGCVTPAGIVISPYGAYGVRMASTTLKRPLPHQGVDFRKPLGSRVMAAADGTVTKATHIPMPKDGWGRFDCRNEVHIEHTGQAEGFRTKYCHLGKVYVNYGDTVKQGEMIGQVGQCAKGPHECSYHLHFEVVRKFLRFNPLEKIAGCFGREETRPTAERPLVYPVHC